MSKVKRLGRFYRDFNLVESEPELVEEIFVQLRFIPYKVEGRNDRETFEYIGISPMFDELEFGSFAPEYVIQGNQDEDETLHVSVSQVA